MNEDACEGCVLGQASDVTANGYEQRLAETGKTQLHQRVGTRHVPGSIMMAEEL